ncbi:hypothetical protein [Streptomyces sp. NBC_01304]|uniref:hypothetical protein n=1 Tax=Streptomyces sp. NBC_01304 TaxID=2903818 RepID=UPI002E10EEAD|nr:hypothetical protein OG430_01580 [Streptomyces sp. NBC_01304]
MPTLPGFRFVADECSTGLQYGGRIDTLGLDENGAPVIIEYWCGQDPRVIDQGLSYLSWLMDHRAEYTPRRAIAAVPTDASRRPNLHPQPPATSSGRNQRGGPGVRAWCASAR